MDLSPDSSWSKNNKLQSGCLPHWVSNGDLFLLVMPVSWLRTYHLTNIAYTFVESWVSLSEAAGWNTPSCWLFVENLWDESYSMLGYNWKHIFLFHGRKMKITVLWKVLACGTKAVDGSEEELERSRPPVFPPVRFQTLVRTGQYLTSLQACLSVSTVPLYNKYSCPWLARMY